MTSILCMLVIVFLLLFPHWANAKKIKMPLMLATDIQDNIPLHLYWVSEKLDGVRAYWDGTQLLTRSGNRIQAPDWFIQGLPSTPLDGELWLGRGQFQALTRIVLDQKPNDAQWRKVQYHCFDLPHSDADFETRQQQLATLVETTATPFLTHVEQSRVSGQAQITDLFQTVVARGGEGLMLRKAGSLYEAGRSDHLIKLKPVDDAEATVIGHQPGQGKYKGLMGSLLVKTKDGREFKIGTGFSMAERKSPPPIGTEITFTYRGLTDSGLPRFASYLRQKDVN